MDAATPREPDTAALARRLHETEVELARVTRRLNRLENATSVRLALMLAAVARHPRKGLAELPHAVTLVRRRTRRVRPAPAPTAVRTARPGAHESAGPRLPDRLPDRLLAASAVLVTIRDRPVLAVVAGVRTAHAWSDAAHVQPLRPDDAEAVFAVVAADVLVVDADAGRFGPWSGLGGYDVPERDRTLLGLLHAARERRVPAVLVASGTPGEAPLLADAGELFTARVLPGATVADLVAAAEVPA